MIQLATRPKAVSCGDQYEHDRLLDLRPKTLMLGIPNIVLRLALPTAGCSRVKIYKPVMLG